MGAGYAGGKNMDVRYALFVIAATLIAAYPVSAEICGIYFSGSCPDCKIIDNYIANESNLTANITLVRYDISNPENAEIARMFLEQYGLSEEYSINDVPFILFSAEHHLSGNDEIKECLQHKVEQFAEEGGNPCPVIIKTAGGAQGSEGGGGGGGEKGEIPGEPDIVDIAAKNPSIPMGIEEGESAGEDKVRETEKESPLKKLREKKKAKKAAENVKNVLPYAYLAFLGAVIVASFIIYKKKSAS